MKKIVLMIFVLFFYAFNARAEHVIDLQPEQITTVRIHTTYHEVTNLRQMATIKINGLNDDCNSGVFFDAGANKETLSFVLSAFVAKADVRIAYDSTIRAPWGDNNYCALVYFDVK